LLESELIHDSYWFSRTRSINASSDMVMSLLSRA
jgi:hypothetical protein